MLYSTISKLGHLYYLSQTLDVCFNSKQLDRAILLSKAKVKCYKDPKDLNRYNELVREYSKNCENDAKSILTVVRDNIIEWSKVNLRCSTLTKAQRIQHGVKNYYSLDVTIEQLNKDISENLQINIQPQEYTKIYNLILDIKAKPKKSKNLKLEYEAILKKIPKFNIKFVDYKRYSDQYNLSLRVLSDMYDRGWKLTSHNNELHLTVKRNKYSLDRVRIIKK